MSKPILSVRNLHVKFTLRGRELHALRGIDLDVLDGESLAIVGESGSGKSVLNKNFIGLLDQNGFIPEGSIRYYGMGDKMRNTAPAPARTRTAPTLTWRPSSARTSGCASAAARSA